jgi:hypothetical protein
MPKFDLTEEERSAWLALHVNRYATSTSFASFPQKVGPRPRAKLARDRSGCEKDGANSWNTPAAGFTLHGINHQETYGLGDEAQTDTNNAEGFFSRIRRREIGHHHHVAGPYLILFAQKAAGREDHKRDPNGS